MIALGSVRNGIMAAGREKKLVACIDARHHTIPYHTIPYHAIRKLGPSGLACRSALDPEGTLKVLTRKLSVLRVSAHEFVYFQFFGKKRRAK